MTIEGDTAMEVVLLIVILVVLLALGARGRTTTKRIEDAAPGTMLVHRAQRTIEREYWGTDGYYHQESAADELSVESCTSVEIKDESGKVSRYTRESLRRAGWF